jgi:hypothetical protein
MYTFTVYLHTDDTACPEGFRETKRMNTDFSATQKSRILIYQNNLYSSIQSVLSVCKMYF